MVFCQFHIKTVARHSFTGETAPFLILSIFFLYKFIKKLTKKPTSIFKKKMLIYKLICLFCTNIIITSIENMAYASSDDPKH